MKKLATLGMTAALALSLAACGGNDKVEDPPENAPEAEQQQPALNDTEPDADTDAEMTPDAEADPETDTDMETDPAVENDSEYSFTEFDLEAKYDGKSDALDVEYENKENKDMEASYKEKVEDIDLHGDEAMEKLDSIFATFDFDENTPDDKVLDFVMKAFNIPDDAEEVDLDITFTSGAEKEYKIK